MKSALILGMTGPFDPNKFKDRGEYVKQFFTKPTFVIGVKGSPSYGLDELLKSHPQLKVVTRFPTVKNGNYLTEATKGNTTDHMLQPAILVWEEKAK